MIKDYAGIEELSAALLNTLIEKVTVGEPKEVDGERIQEIKIYFKHLASWSFIVLGNEDPSTCTGASAPSRLGCLRSRMAG